MSSGIMAGIVAAGVTVGGAFAVGAWGRMRKKVGNNCVQTGVNAKAINDLAERAKEQAALTQTVFKKIDEDRAATAKFREHVCEELGAVCQQLKIDGKRKG